MNNEAINYEANFNVVARECTNKGWTGNVRTVGRELSYLDAVQSMHAKNDAEPEGAVWWIYTICEAV